MNFLLTKFTTRQVKFTPVENRWLMESAKRSMRKVFYHRRLCCGRSVRFVVGVFGCLSSQSKNIVYRFPAWCPAVINRAKFIQSR